MYTYYGTCVQVASSLDSTIFTLYIKKEKIMFLVHVSHMGFEPTILKITGNEESGDDLLDDLTGCAGTLSTIAHTIYINLMTNSGS